MKEIKPKLETEGFKVDVFDFVGSPKPLPKNIGKRQSSPKSLDTTTTIDTITNIFADYDIGNINVFEAMDRVEAWHKDKARSYVPEKREYAPKLTLINPDDPVHYNAIAFGQNEAIDQTLKAIGGQENE